MKNLHIFLIFSLLLVVSCKSTFNVEIKTEDRFDISPLKSLMSYPNMKISNFNTSNFNHLKKTHEFQILKEEPVGTYFIALESFNENIEYLKELYVYYRKLYKVLLAYSSVQGGGFRSEIFSYLDKQGIKENFPLRLKFPYSKTLVNEKTYITMKKVYFDMLLEDKTSLMVSNQKMENIVINFLK